MLFVFSSIFMVLLVPSSVRGLQSTSTPPLYATDINDGYGMDVNEALLHSNADLGVANANGDSTNLMFPVSFILGLGLLLSLMVVGIVCCCCDHDLNKILKNRKTMTAE